MCSPLKTTACAGCPGAKTQKPTSLGSPGRRAATRSSFSANPGIKTLSLLRLGLDGALHLALEERSESWVNLHDDFRPLASGGTLWSASAAARASFITVRAWAKPKSGD